MKQLITSCFILLLTTMGLMAQNTQYQEMMSKNIANINYNASMEQLQDAANQMERVATVEKSEWLPSYYSSLAYVYMATKELQKGGGEIMSYVDKAQASLNKAKEIAPDNSEVLTAQGYIYMAHIWPNPMANGAKYTPMAFAQLDKAIKADPTNPRPHYLKGQNLFYTPAAFGGGKKNAAKQFKMAEDKFAAFKPASDISPNWGEESNAYFFNQCKPVEKSINTKMQDQLSTGEN